MDATVLLAPPYVKDIAESGVAINARIDPAATMSLFPKTSVVDAVGEAKLIRSAVSVRGAADVSTMFTGLVALGVETTDGLAVLDQVEVVLGDSEGIALLGADVLSALRLRVNLDYGEDVATLQRYGWESFEHEVAGIYRRIGAKVQQNVSLAGFQIDVLVEEATPSGQPIRLAVECKFYRERVGNRIVNDHARVVSTLKEAGLADRGVIVSSSGFTKDAHLVADASGLELMHIDDLRMLVPKHDGRVREDEEVAQQGKVLDDSELISHGDNETAKPTVFVVMPFDSALDDVYHLGIREVVDDLGASCQRVDELQYVGGILDKIYDSLRCANVIVAEMSHPNPNVYYEVGYAHALGKKVVLLTNDVDASPFDLRGYVHIVYDNIRDLRQRLGSVLRSLL